MQNFMSVAATKLAILTMGGWVGGHCYGKMYRSMCVCYSNENSIYIMIEMTMFSNDSSSVLLNTWNILIQVSLQL